MEWLHCDVRGVTQSASGRKRRLRARTPSCFGWYLLDFSYLGSRSFCPRDILFLPWWEDRVLRWWHRYRCQSCELLKSALLAQSCLVCFWHRIGACGIFLLFDPLCVRCIFGCGFYIVLHRWHFLRCSHRLLATSFFVHFDHWRCNRLCLSIYTFFCMSFVDCREELRTWIFLSKSRHFEWWCYPGFSSVWMLQWVILWIVSNFHYSVDGGNDYVTFWAVHSVLGAMWWQKSLRGRDVTQSVSHMSLR